MGEDLSLQAYQELIEHTTDIVIVVDESGVIQYESPSVQRVTGYSPEERVAESVFEHVHPDDQQKVRDTFAEALNISDDTIHGAEFRFRHKDGSWLWLEARGGNQTATAIDGFVVTLRDITQRKEYEQELIRERNRTDRFVSTLSHDLRNPLNVLEGRLELVKEEHESEHLDAMARSVDRLNELITEVLTLTRVGDSDLRADAVNIRESSENCWQNTTTEAGSLVFASTKTIRADERQLQRLLENLFHNAVEHGGEDVTVTVGALDDGFYVEDDGTGIPENIRDSMLEYGVSTKSNGTGLGLSIVSEIVENHNWNLSVAESENGGARFQITGVDTTGE
jgi:PAS domain S-box-containing protein